MKVVKEWFFSLETTELIILAVLSWLFFLSVGVFLSIVVSEYFILLSVVSVVIVAIFAYYDIYVRIPRTSLKSLTDEGIESFFKKYLEEKEAEREL